MKVSLHWLREYVELPPTVDALVSLLTMAGVEVEGVETTGCAIAKIVAAEIKSSEQHPNADRLSVCQVDDGSGTVRQIVCGAKNYRVGDKVPLALPGAQLAPDFVIKVGKLRGVESQGMMCSADELKLPATLGHRGAEDGLLILAPDTALGTPITDLFAGDTVLDLEITPNRPDLLSHAGIAREIATLTGKALNDPLEKSTAVESGDGAARIAVEDATLCPLYTCRRICGVKVGPSPEWLRKKLEAVGLRTINNVVDITNYLQLEVGHPLHAFDAAKLDGALQVRRAAPDEAFHALDGKTYALKDADLVIADQSKVVALAGVMGGEYTGVTETTTDIVLEAAVFQPAVIRRSSRRLALNSDSSYRFERGVDIGKTLRTSARATQLIVELCGGQPQSIEWSTQPNQVRADRTVKLRADRVSALLGVSVPNERIAAILSGFGLVDAGEQGWRIPSYRSDLAREVDLIEEIARVIGMDTIPSKTEARFLPGSATDRAYDRAMELRRALVAAGLHEGRSVTLVPERPLGWAATQTSGENLQRVKNPMIDDQVVLRPNLLHGLLTAVGDNFRAGQKAVRLFEVGRVFSTRKPEEFSHAAIVLSGASSERNWRGAEGRAYDLFDLYGILGSAIGATCEAEPNEALALSAVVKVNGKPVGFAGQLWPAEARGLDAETPVVFAEIDLAALAKAEATGVAKRYTEIPRFPPVTRDVALLAPLGLTHERIVSTLTGAKEPLLARVELFDVFTDVSGTKIPADKKSLAYSLTYRSAERTLTADEVSVAHAKLKDRLKTELGVLLRE
jgi:phenylalanyl-tRNA synthetase beta chain